MRGFLTVCSLVVSLALGAALGIAPGACGGCNDSNSVGHLPDAPPAPDGSPADSEGLPVTLTIVKEGSPASGVTVYFLNADDSVVSATLTDAMGIAHAVMAAGGSVTAVNPFTTPLPPAAAADPDELRTFVGVKPGDRLVLSHTTPVAATLSMIAPSAPSSSSATTYSVFTTCGSGGISVGSGAAPRGQLDLEDCNGTVHLAVVANSPPLAARVAQVNSIVEVLYKADVALPGAGNTLDLTGDLYGGVTPVPFAYTNVNPSDRPISALHWLIQDRGHLGPFPVDASGGTGTSHVPSGITAPLSIIQTSLAPSGAAIGEHDVIDWGVTLPSYTLDLGGLLPDLLSPPAFDAATGRVTWTEDAPGAAPDLTTTAILVTRSQQWHWEIVAPYKQGAIRFPHLPADVFDWNPATGDNVIAEQVMNVKAPGGYDAIRAHILDLRDRVLRHPAVVGPPDLSGFVNGLSGRVVVVQSSPP